MESNVRAVLEQALSTIAGFGKSDELEALIDAAAKGNTEIARKLSIVKKGLSELAGIAKTNVLSCAAKRKEYEDTYQKLHQQEEDLYAEYDKNFNEKKGYEKEIFLLQSQINNTQYGIANYSLQIARCDADIEKANRDIAEAEKKLYWAWVATPALIGALVHLKATRDSSQTVKSNLRAEIDQLVKLSQDLKTEVHRLSDFANTMEVHSSKLGIRLNQLSTQISETISIMAEAGYLFALWEGLELLLGKAVGAIEKSRSQERILESFQLLVEMKTQIEEAEMETESVKNSVISGLVYRGNALYQGQTLHRGEYIASLNKRFVAVLAKDGKFAVYTAEKENRIIAEHVDKVSFERDGIVRFGEKNTKRGGATVFMMQNDGNLVAYDWEYHPLWASDTWRFGYVTQKSFFFLLPSYSGSYKIASRKQYVLDVLEGSYSNSAQVQIYTDCNQENQRFRFEQSKSGTYTITAIHSGKVLDIAGASKANGVKLIQFDAHGGENQQFWVLPCDKPGYVKIVAAHSEKTLDVYGGNFADCTDLQQYHENGSEAQRFELVRC